MKLRSTYSLALCLLAAGNAHAQDAVAPAEADGTYVPGTPPNLLPEEVVQPAAAEPAPASNVSNAPASPPSPRKIRPAPMDTMPVRDPGGRVLLPRGTTPTIVCAPLRVCDIELQPGEKVQGAPHIGDSVRWKIAPAVSGTGNNAVTHLIVKPTESGLDTNLIVTTDRGVYHLRLVSSAVHYVSSVAFESPAEDQESAWRTFNESYSAGGDQLSDRDMPVVAVNRLNFNYRIEVVKGKPAFKPLRAMDDGYRTYIAMNEEMLQGEAPALIGISPSGEEQMVNYRLKGNLYVIDGTVGKIALISGVGRRQERIELTRDPCRTRGWLGICWDPKE